MGICLEHCWALKEPMATQGRRPAPRARTPETGPPSRAVLCAGMGGQHLARTGAVATACPPKQWQPLPDSAASPCARAGSNKHTVGLQGPLAAGYVQSGLASCASPLGTSAPHSRSPEQGHAKTSPPARRPPHLALALGGPSLSVLLSPRWGRGCLGSAQPCPRRLEAPTYPWGTPLHLPKHACPRAAFEGPGLCLG